MDAVVKPDETSEAKVPSEPEEKESGEEQVEEVVEDKENENTDATTEESRKSVKRQLENAEDKGETSKEGNLNCIATNSKYDFLVWWNLTLCNVYIEVERPTKVQKQDEGEEELDDDDDDDNLKTKKSAADIAALQRYLPQVEIKTLETAEGGGCTHVVAIPTSTYYIPLHPIEKPVKTWPFKLDTFQDRAITCVDNYQSVLVSAHTSAGKTVVAE